MATSKEQTMKYCIKIISLLSVALVLGAYSTAEALNDYSGWAYKVKITVNNPTATAATNYPVRIDVPAKTYIDAGSMNSDMGDVRFADSAGYPLPFWINITENMVRNFNNIPVYVKLKTFNAGDNTIYMYFDSAKTKNNKTPKIDLTNVNYLASDVVGDYCGDAGSPLSPYSGAACGDGVFGKFAMACDDTDFTADSPCKAAANARWLSKTAFGSVNDAADVHFRMHYNSHTNFYTYFMVQNNTAPAVASIDKYCGYRLRFERVGTMSTAADTYNMDSTRLHIELKTANCATTTPNVAGSNGGWADIAGSPITAWGPYNNSIQDFDIKATSSTIKLFINYQQVGATLNRSASESWTGGYAGFNRGDFTDVAESGSNSTDGISPLWFINNYIGSEPVVTFVGNTDITIKRILPTADAAYIGLDVINYTPTTQILEDYIDGDTLDKYVYNGYPAANPTKQTFKTAVTIRNRGTVTDTFDINLALTGVTSQWSIVFDNGSGLNANLPGTGATPTTGSVTLAAGASTIIYITAMPTASALFEGAYGRLILDFAVSSRQDHLFDNARFLFNINGKTGCYWKWKLPITVGYNDTNGTGLLVDHQVLVNLTSMDFTDARPDGADIIFTDANGTALPFSTKSFTKGTSTTGAASYWVKVHNLAAGAPGATTINMWWGNAGYSPTRSSMKATFDLWEDWETDTTLGALPNYSGVGAVVGGAGDPHGWKNNPQPANNFNPWSIQSRLDGKAVKAAAQATSDFGPILAGGDMRWKSYEASYSFYTEFAGTNALYNPVFFQDAGNGWGMEFFSNLFIFRPFGSGTDWTWARQINASAKLGNSTFPANNKRYWVKIRLFQNPSDSKTHLKLFISPTDSGTTAPADTDADTNYTEVTPATTGIIPDTAFNLSNGMIGFGGWDGGFSNDNIRVRKYTEPQPTCTKGTAALTNYAPITTLSMPVLTAPMLNGRSVLLNGMMTTFKWTGDLVAVYADCYIAGDCNPAPVTGEDATKKGTISLWGKVDDYTPKGFGDQLKQSVAGDNNRTSIDDSSWQANGRYIFTAYDSNGDGKISCTTTAADCIALGTSNAATLKNMFGDTASTKYSLEPSPYPLTTNLIKFTRGQYVSAFTRSDIRNQCTSGTADSCQWKLGDVTHSNPLVVGVPNMLYADPAYDTFRTNNSGRDMVVYASSNEGMVHAIRMSKYNTTTKKYTVDSSATELWAFVPNALLPVLKDTTDNYHEYTDDGLLRAIDIKATGTAGTYKSVLIGGLRSGGQSLYALDVTDPRSANLMWEINKSTNSAEFTKIGKTWSAPALGRLCETAPCDGTSTTNRWVAIIGSGFDPNGITNLSKTAYLSFVDIETGSVIKQINVSTKPGNLTTNIGVLRDKNGYIQKVYFGDYYGAIWRVDLSITTKVTAMLAAGKTALADADMLFKPSDYATSNVTDAANLPQRPITAQPAISYAKDSSGNDVWWVYFGTGVFDTYDASYPYQRFYGLKDTVATPYLDTGLTDMTYTTATNSSKNNWFMELGHTDSRDYEYSGTSTATCITTCIGQGYTGDYCDSKCKNVTTSAKGRNERVISSPTIYGGFVFISSYTPSSNVCGGGVARFYAVSYDTGSYNSSLLQFGNVTDGRSVAISTGGGIPSTPMVYTGKSGTGQIVGSGLVDTSTGGLTKTPLDPDKFSLNINLLLWRRVR